MNGFAYAPVHTVLGIAQKSVTALDSSSRWSIVRVGTVITCCWRCWLQYQLISTCIEQRYCDLTTNYTAFIIFPSIVVLSCSVCLWCEHDNIKSISCRVRCVNGSIFFWFNQRGHIITYYINSNLAYFIKCVRRGWILRQFNNVTIVKVP